MPGHSRKRAGLALPGNGSWPKFRGGEATTHGAYSPARVEPLASAIVADLFGNGEIPPYLRDPAYVAQIRAWARAEAEAALIYDHMQKMTPEERLMPPKPGTAPMVETWRKMEGHAANLRRDLGLTPMAKAKLGRTLQPTVDVAALMAQLVAEDGADDGSG